MLIIPLLPMGKSLYIKKTLTVIIINYSIEKFIDLGSEILEQTQRKLYLKNKIEFK